MNKVVKDISSAAKDETGIRKDLVETKPAQYGGQEHERLFKPSIWDDIKGYTNRVIKRLLWILLIAGFLVLGGPLIQSIFKWVYIGFVVLYLLLAAAGGVICLWEWISGRRRNLKSEQ